MGTNANRKRQGKKPAHVNKSRAHLAGVEILRRYPRTLPRHGAGPHEQPQTTKYGLGMRRKQPKFGLKPL